MQNTIRKKKYCWILEQKNFDSDNLFNLIMKILQDRNNLKNISLKMKKNNDKKTFENIKKIIEIYLK